MKSMAELLVVAIARLAAMGCRLMHFDEATRLIPKRVSHWIVSRYNFYVLRTFRHRALKRLFKHGDKSKLRADQVERIEEILSRLDTAVGAKDLNTPGYRLHPLTGNLQGFWSVRVSANVRIMFRFEADDVYDVDLTDYH